MIPKKISGTLMYPLYKLFYIDDIASFSGLSEKEILVYRQRYDEQRRDEIVEALRWVAEHPDADLTNIHAGLRFTNIEIHEFARKMLCSLETS